MSTNPKDTAFPLVEPLGGTSGAVNEGLSKREYFAAAALQGLLANVAWMKQSVELPERELSTAATAQFAVEHADYLIGALNKQEAP